MKGREDQPRHEESISTDFLQPDAKPVQTRLPSPLGWG
jgi:hypothetical protein